MSHPNNNGNNEQGAAHQSPQERYSQRRRWPHIWPRRRQVAEPVPPSSVGDSPKTTPVSGVVPPIASPSLRNATALPQERYTGSAGEPPSVDEDSTPTLDTSRMVLQRFSGAGVAPLSTVQRQEGRARMVTLVLATAAILLVVSSAFLLFAPFVRHPGIGMQPKQFVMTKTSAASAIATQQGTPSEITSTTTPQTHPTATSLPPSTPTPVDPHAPRVHETADFPLSGATGNETMIRGNDGDMWLGMNGKIARVTPSGQVSYFPIPTAGVVADFLTVGPDGNIWFTEGPPSGSTSVNGKIGKITPSGVITEYPPSPGVVRLNGGNSLGTITRGPDGNLWYSDGVKLFRMTTSGVNLDQQGLSVGNNLVECCNPMDTGPDNNVWGIAWDDSVSTFPSALLKISPSGQVLARIENPPISSTFYPISNFVLSQNALWAFPLQQKGQFDQILPNGTITAISLPSDCRNTFGLTRDASGRLWFPCADAPTIAPAYNDYGMYDPTTHQFKVMYTDDPNAFVYGERLVFGTDNCLHSEVKDSTHYNPAQYVIRKYCTHP